MYIPKFAIRNREREILASKLTKEIVLKEFAYPLTVYVVTPKDYEEICNFVEGFRESLNEDSSSNRPSLLRAVTQIVNTLSDVQKIKDPDLKTAAGASILSAIMGVYALAPEYGSRLIGMLKSKI